MCFTGACVVTRSLYRGINGGEKREAHPGAKDLKFERIPTCTADFKIKPH